MKKWQTALGILVVAGLALAAVVGNLGARGKESGQGATAPAGEKPALPQPGYPAPDFKLQDMEGKTVRLSDFKGKPVLINFWASWCPPCNAEMPDLVKKSEAYKDRIVFLGVNLTQTESEAEGPKKFIEKYNVQFRTLLDEKGEAANLYQALGIPTTVTVAPNGVIVDRFTGAMTEDTMERFIQNLLKK